MNAVDYHLVLTLIRDHTERTGPETRRRQVTMITFKSWVSARAWDWEPSFELLPPKAIQRGYALPARVTYTFIGQKPDPKKIEQDTDAILRQMKRICDFTCWKDTRWRYEDQHLERLPATPKSGPESGTVAPMDKEPNLTDFHYEYRVIASPLTSIEGTNKIIPSALPR
jgi:hypothetical protein